MGQERKGAGEMAETKIIYHIDEEETPYLVKIPIPAEQITLLDFKQVLNKPNYKFFFKSMDQDFGWVRERDWNCVQSITSVMLLDT